MDMKKEVQAIVAWLKVVYDFAIKYAPLVSTVITSITTMINSIIDELDDIAAKEMCEKYNVSTISELKKYFEDKTVEIAVSVIDKNENITEEWITDWLEGKHGFDQTDDGLKI
jgi:hypothetical protein